MNKKSVLNPLNIIFISLLTAAIFFINYQNLSASDKDLILVIDTSYSMSGHARGSKNILPQVKKSLPQFVEQLDKDDSITLITFETDVKIYPTVYISNKDNKESLIEYINNIEAKGKWTYTSQMMRTVFQKAAELEKKDKDRQRVIVIITDSIDDPPPGKLYDGLNIRDVAKNYKDKDWFIFFINMGEPITNTRLTKLQNELKTSVSKYSTVTNVNVTEKGGKTGTISTADIEKNIAKTIEKGLPADIEKMSETKMESEKKFSLIPIIIALIIIAAVIAFIYIFKMLSGIKVTGKLEYWDHTVISPYYENYDLTKQNKKEILVGSRNICNLTIRDIDIKDPFKITASRKNGEIKNTLHAGKGYIIEYVNRDAGDYLNNGDIFKIANYTFKFTSA